MRRHCTFLHLLLAVLLLSFAGCAPVFELKHDAGRGYTYDSSGSIRVLLFEDDRPAKEQKVKTAPAMNVFLRDAIVDEIQKSGLFSISESADPEFELSGQIRTLKLKNKPGILQKIGGGLIVLAGIGSLGQSLGLIDILVLDGAGLVCMFASTNTLLTTVAIDAALTKEGKEIWSASIYEEGKDKARISSVNSEIPVSFDRIITVSIRKMLGEISGELSGGS